MRMPQKINWLMLNKYLIKLSKTRSRQGLYEFIGNQYSLIPSGAKVLSVGSGGEINRLLEKCSNQTGFHVESLDIDPNRYPDILGDICSYQFNSHDFDVVVMCEVLEHLHSPKLGINNIYKALRQGGKLILSTPFILPIHDAPNDYFRFTKYGLELLLCDFDDVNIEPRNSYFEAIDVLWLRLLQEKKGNSFFACLAIIPFVYYIKRPLTRLLGWMLHPEGMTTGYTVTAIKK